MAPRAGVVDTDSRSFLVGADGRWGHHTDGVRRPGPSGYVRITQSSAESTKADRMSTTRRSIAEDLQGSRPAASISLTGAGVTRSAKAIRIRHNHAERLFHAEIASFCDLG